jgi:hypothetical protein
LWNETAPALGNNYATVWEPRIILLTICLHHDIDSAGYGIYSVREDLGAVDINFLSRRFSGRCFLPGGLANPFQPPPPWVFRRWACWPPRSCRRHRSLRVSPRLIVKQRRDRRLPYCGPDLRAT